MDSQKIDRLPFRIVAVFLAAFAIFGWDWFAPYRTKLVDEWELPILSLLLIIVAVSPERLVVNPSIRSGVALMAFVAIATFVWWLVERGLTGYGGYDVGGILLRVGAYGLVLYLLFPKKKIRLG